LTRLAGKSRPAIACIGAGRLARTLLPELDAAGYRIAAVASPRIGPARSLGRQCAGSLATIDASRAAEMGRLILLAVPDRIISDLARKLATTIDWKTRTVLHHAGALGPEVLRPLARAGASTGVFHPLQTLGDPPIARRLLAGSRVRLEGQTPALRVARRLARDLGMIPLALPIPTSASDRSAYHAAASLVSNDLVALLAQAADLLESTGLSRAQAVRALVPLASGTLAQIRGSHPARALSGPLVRGDVSTVQAQLAALDRHSRPAAALHRLLSTRLLDAAREAGHPLPDGALAELRKLLRS
jgi:predicted short-subunit dehydrogenase-like oxidoreductase (DUF2520 family)